MSEKYTEEMKNHFLAMAGMMREVNRKIEVSGERFAIPAKGREISIVYYAAKSEKAPLILGFHGGGFLFGGNALNDAMWKAVSDRLDVNIASVGYRKSPDHQFRASLEDCLEALRYFRSHAADYGFDPDRIAAMGCSAGANLAATLSIYAKQQGEAPFWFNRKLLLTEHP